MLKKQLLTTAVMTMVFVVLVWVLFPSTFVFKEGADDDYISVYAPVAYNLLAGKGFTQGGKISLDYPPGFSCFLAGVFYIAGKVHVTDTTALTIAKVLLMFAANVCILLLTRLFWPGKRAVIASILWITYPLILWNVCQRNSELLFMPIFYLAVYFFIRLRSHPPAHRQAMIYSLFSGALFGCAALVRPIALFVPLILTMAYLIVEKDTSAVLLKVRNALFFVIACIITILPWELMIYQNTGKVLLLSNKDVYSIYDGLTFGVLDEGFREGFTMPQDVRDVMVNVADTGPEVYTSKKEIVGKLIGEFKRAPWAVVKLYVLKTFRVWYGTNSNRFENKIALIQVLYGLFWLVMVIKAWKLPALQPITIYILILTVYFWGMAVLVLSIVRYMVPVLGLFFVFSPVLADSGAVRYVYEKIRQPYDTKVQA